MKGTGFRRPRCKAELYTGCTQSFSFMTWMRWATRSDSLLRFTLQNSLYVYTSKPLKLYCTLYNKQYTTVNFKLLES